MQGNPQTSRPVLSSNTLGRYQLVREIARSNDIVYEAVDPVMGRRLALKELQMPPNLAGGARRERIERFYREARAAGALTHANIVTIYEVGEDRGRHFIAMEFLEGESLRDRLQRVSTLPAHEAIRIGTAVAEGRQFAHEHGVIHRDVKPDNVHLLPDGRVKLTDFGIARITFEPTLTADGQIFGTPSYMSPEQVTGKQIDARSDLFSLGVMLYEMLAGRKPFTGDSVITITYNIVNVNPSPLGVLAPQLEGIIRRAMAKDPARRQRSAGEVAGELGAAASRTPGAVPVLPAHPTGGAQPALPSATMNARGALPPSAGAPLAGSPHSQPSAGFPRPAPQPLFPGSAATGRAGTPPRSRVAVPTGYPSTRGAPPLAVPPPPAQPIVSPETRWLLGWLGVSAAVGVLILVLVYSVIVSLERRPGDRAGGAGAAAGSIAAQAKKAADLRDWFRAWQLYKQSAEKGEAPVGPLRWNAATCAVNWAHEQKNTAPGEAEKACNEAKQLAPDYGESYHLLAVIAFDRENMELSQAYFDEAAAAWRRRQAQPGLGDPEREEAGKRLNDTLTSNAQALLSDGQRLAADGQTELAAQRFRKAARVAPGSMPAQEAARELARLGESPGFPGP